jgi:hypothetical protein
MSKVSDLKVEIQVNQETLKMLIGKIATQENLIANLIDRINVLESSK